MDTVTGFRFRRLNCLGDSSSTYRYGITDAQSEVTSVTYDYYKLELDTSEATNFEIADRDIILFNENRIASSTGSLLSLGYKGSGITFTNAPAADAIITLDAKIDRPFKNSNFVIDASMSLHFGGA